MTRENPGSFSLVERLRMRPDSDCREAADRIEELEAALRPFANEADTHGDQIPDGMFIWDYAGEFGGRNNLRVGDLRNARTALAAKEG